MKEKNVDDEKKKGKPKAHAPSHAKIRSIGEFSLRRQEHMRRSLYRKLHSVLQGWRWTPPVPFQLKRCLLPHSLVTNTTLSHRSWRGHGRFPFSGPCPFPHELYCEIKITWVWLGYHVGPTLFNQHLCLSSLALALWKTHLLRRSISP